VLVHYEIRTAYTALPTDFNIVLLEEEWIHPESDLDTMLLSI